MSEQPPTPIKKPRVNDTKADKVEHLVERYERHRSRVRKSPVWIKVKGACEVG